MFDAVAPEGIGAEGIEDEEGDLVLEEELLKREPIMGSGFQAGYGRNGEVSKKNGVDGGSFFLQ